MASKSETADSETSITIWSRRIITIAFVAAYALALAQLIWPVDGLAKLGWLESALLLLTAAGTLTALAQHLPWQNVLSVSAIIIVVGGGLEWLNLKTGLPFGPIIAGAKIEKLFHALPWAMPLIWLIAILNSRGVARLILRPWRKTKNYGFRVIGLTAALSAIFEFAFEPFATRVKEFWFWEPTKLPVAWHGAPLIDFFSWIIIAGLILIFSAPLLINKQLSKRRSPDFQPLAVWIGGILFFGVGCAFQNLWSATGADAVIGIVALIFAIRGARW